MEIWSPDSGKIVTVLPRKSKQDDQTVKSVSTNQYNLLLIIALVTCDFSGNIGIPLGTGC